MSSTANSGKDDDGSPSTSDPKPPTFASFSQVTLSQSPPNKQRSTILVHQKSPLLIATPPQITRALAYSHPFLLPLNKVAGLLTWTTDDSWESFLVVASFWAIVIYGDIVMRWMGPVVVVIGLILGMYSRRYSPLSSAGLVGKQFQKGHKREDSEVTNVKHQKSLDEIVETLKIFTSRCNVLLGPFLQLTDFLSTQRTATSATTRPALTTLFVRIILVTPLWVLLTLPPLRIITTKRIVLVAGTLMLSWHSKPTRVTRAILWRSAFVRRVCAAVTGLKFSSAPSVPDAEEDGKKPAMPSKGLKGVQSEASLAVMAAAKRKASTADVRFTFILYENQRRWVGLGWTTSLFAYERTAWTDEHLNEEASKDDFKLPQVEGGHARWRWVEGSKWLVEGAGEMDEGGRNAKAGTTDGGQGWIYYDNKWQNGRRGQDGWGRYTRRRKWYRDAELVEITPSTVTTPSSTPPGPSISDKSREPDTGSGPILHSESPPKYSEAIGDDSSSTKSSGLRRGGPRRSNTSGMSGTGDLGSEEEGVPGHRPPRARHGDWGIGDEAIMNLE